MLKKTAEEIEAKHRRRADLEREALWRVGVAARLRAMLEEGERKPHRPTSRWVRIQAPFLRQFLRRA